MASHPRFAASHTMIAGSLNRVWCLAAMADQTDSVGHLDDLQRAEVLSTVAARIAERLEVPEIARVLCAEARAAFGEHVRATLLLSEADGGGFFVAHTEGAPPGSMTLPTRYDPPSVPLSELRREGRLTYLPDVAHAAPDVVASAGRTGVRGLAFVYLFNAQAVVGVLSLSTFDRPLVLDKADLFLLRGMADQGASAITYAQLLTASRLTAQRYHNILETVFDGINITGFDGVIRYCNSQFAAMLGATPEQVVGKAMPDLLFPEDLAAAHDRIRRRREGHTAPMVWRLRALDDGREVFVRANSRELKDESGQPSAMLGVISDITRSRRLEEKLLQAQKLESLGVLAGGIAHDFNNLLVGALGNAGLALMELPPESPVRPLIEEIQKATVRAADLTRQLLSYSGKGRFVLAHLDLARVVDEMSQLLGSVITERVAIRYELARDLPPVEADAAQIRQVLMNLVTNASDAIGDRPGVITVSTSVVEADAAYLADTFVDDGLAPGRFVCLEVADTGAGMTAETVAKIFDLFYTTKFVGRGLGLAAVLGILRSHKGAIKVSSEPSRGTTFTVLLPACVAAVEAPAPVAAAPRSKARGVVLVVDDEEGVRNVARRIFEREGFRVLLASDGAEGVEVFRAHHQDVCAVLLDVTMPRMGGEAAFAEMRRIRGDVRVLLTSGYSEQEATARFAGHGLAGFVEKPFHPQGLVAKLRGVLGGD